MFHNRQSQSGFTEFSRASAVDAIESFKQTFEMVRRNSFAAIADDDLIAFMADKGNCDHAAVAIKFDGIVDQVRKHLHQTTWICKDLCFSRDQVPYFDLSSSGCR